jgi:hypothetical protein
MAAELGARLPDERADIDGEVLAGFLDELARVDLGKPWIMSRLRWAAYRSGMAAVRGALDRDIPVNGGFDSQPPPPPYRHPDFVLVRAVADGVITESEAELIGVTRLEGVALTGYAHAHGLHPEACAARRLRAEYRLVAYLLDPATAVDPPEDDGGMTDQVTVKLAVDRAARDGGPRLTRRRTVTAAERARSQKLRQALPPRRPKSGVRRCGETPPENHPASVPPETSEVPRCA